MVYSKSGRFVLGALALTAFLDSVGFGIVIPLLPFYIQKFGATALEFGLVVSVYSLAQLLFTPYVSRLSDIRGRKSVLSLGVTSEVLGYLLIAFSPFFLLILLARFITGALNSNLPVIYSYVTDVTAQEQRARAVGLIGASFGLGFVLGPFIGGTLAPLGYRVAFVVPAMLSLINLLFITIFLNNKVGELLVKPPTMLKSFRASRKFFFIFFGTYLGFSILQGTLAYYGQILYGWGPIQVGIALGLVGIEQAILQSIVAYRVVNKLGEYVTTVIGLVLSILSYLLIFLGFSENILYLSLALFALGNGLFQNAALTLISKTFSKEMRGASFGFSQSATALATLIGFPLGDFFLQYVSVNSEYAISAVAAFITLVYFYFAFKADFLPAGDGSPHPELHL